MPTKNTTTSNNSLQFDPNSMNVYRGFQTGGSNVLQQDISDPLSQIGFNQRLAMGNQNAFNLFSARNQGVANRASAFGGNTPLFLQNQFNRNANMLSGMQANNFNQNLLYADQVRQNAATQMLGYRPLQTGSNTKTTQQTSGVGTWLGPAASIGLGIATGGMSAFSPSVNPMMSMGRNALQSAGPSTYANYDNSLQAPSGPDYSQMPNLNGANPWFNN